jgi:hypothetical protein
MIVLVKYFNDDVFHRFYQKHKSVELKYSNR